ncbi:MAG: hypothetical protein AAFU38_10230 [Bacteroidota bacterium]
MQTFEIVPHHGIGPILLGMTPAEARAAMAPHGGLQASHGDVDYFLTDNALQVEYEGGQASFIGASHSRDVAFAFRGIDPFDTAARMLFRHIASFESGAHRFDRAEYRFPDQIVTLWEADRQYDYRGGERRLVYAQVGVGSAAYLAAIQQYDLD